jgi:outer membrane protein assembly factor BamB
MRNRHCPALAIVKTTVLFAVLLAPACLCPARLLADDWPEIQGQGRRGVWNETGILDKFPEAGLTVGWRTPIHAGYAGPAVAAGRVFVADYQKTTAGQVERALCLDEQTGQILWTYENPEVRYSDLPYGTGPRATPTVDGDRVYVLGAVGDLYCLAVKDGNLLWKVNFKKDFHARQATWGWAAAPIVHGNLVICLAGSEPDGKVIALDRATGKEVWRSLPNKGGTGYAAPILLRAGGVEQLIQWHQGAVSSLDPSTGKVYWEQPFQDDLLVSTPVYEANLLLVSAFRIGSLMLDLAADKPEANELWRGKSHSEVNTDGLHCMTSTPVIVDGYVYGVCSYGQFRCLNARTGERIWESLEVTGEKARWASAFLTRNGSRFFINNDRGDLIIAELSPKGYREVSRAKLITPTSPGGGKRELGAVNWVLPAYANRHILIRNDQEIIRVSLEAAAATATASAPAVK